MQIYIYFMMEKKKYVAKYGNLSISPFSTKKWCSYPKNKQAFYWQHNNLCNSCYCWIKISKTYIKTKLFSISRNKNNI